MKISGATSLGVSPIARARHVELVVVARVGARLVSLVDALGDVRRLLVDGGDHRARVAVEPVHGVVVADAVDGLADDLRHVHVGRGRNFPGHHDEAGVDEGLAGDAPVGVVRQHGVENTI